MAAIIGSYTELETRLIAAAYYTSNRLDKDSVTISEIAAEFNFPMPDRFLKIALTHLSDMGYSEEKMFGGALEDQRIWLTALGIREAEAIIERDETDVLEFRNEMQAAPASDRTVSFSDNQADVEVAKQNIGSAIQVIAASNSLAPEEKDVWIGLLEQGKALLNNPKTYLAAVSALLLKPLYDAYASVIEESSKPVILAAIEAVRALLP